MVDTDCSNIHPVASGGRISSPNTSLETSSKVIKPSNPRTPASPKLHCLQSKTDWNTSRHICPSIGLLESKSTVSQSQSCNFTASPFLVFISCTACCDLGHGLLPNGFAVHARCQISYRIQWRSTVAGMLQVQVILGRSRTVHHLEVARKHHSLGEPPQI